MISTCRGREMSSLKIKETSLFEKLFGMETGYVLNFNDRTFQNFILESTGIDIFDGKYNAPLSKAKRLRLFWKKEDDYITHKLLSDMLAYWFDNKQAYGHEFSDEELLLHEKCKKALNMLQGTNLVEDLNSITSVDVLNYQSIQVLSAEIKEKLLGGQPELALDRLHTFSVRYFRALCQKYRIPYEQKDALHTLFSKYQKYLEASGRIQSNMTLQIIKANMNVLNNFNHVRNTESYAHDNVILNKNESKLICNHVISLLKFVDEIEMDAEYAF